MNKTTLVTSAVIAVILSVGISYVIAPKSSPSLGSYTPPVQSASGFSQSLSASSTLAATSFCDPTNIQFLGSNAVTTSTLPAATSTYASCPNSVNFGASVGGLIVNDSTNTANFAVGTGDVVKCETNGVGTSTVSGTCTASAFQILASTTVSYQMFFDSSSSTLVFLVGNNYK